LLSLLQVVLMLLQLTNIQAFPTLINRLLFKFHNILQFQIAQAPFHPAICIREQY